MLEVCVEDIAMSTRVLPLFLGCRMSELRRHLVPSPTPASQQQQQQQDITAQQQAQVRRNLFGPIDHDENLKFVQNELSRIAQSDCKKWNFDFEAEKPHEGRFTWEPVTEAVPQAYEMPRLHYLSSAPKTRCGTNAITTPHNATSSTNVLAPSTSSSSSSSSSTSVPCVPECLTPSAAAILTTTSNTTTTTTTTTTTSDKPTFTKTSIQPSCSTDAKSSSGSDIVVVRPRPIKQCNNNNTSSGELTLKTTKDRRERLTPTSKRSSPSSVKTPRLSQPPLTAFMKISKNKRAAPTKLEDEQPPALVKRSKTTTS